MVFQDICYRGLNLGSWVNTLRHTKDKLTPERRQRLNDLGFVWDANIYTWEKHFTALFQSRVWRLLSSTNICLSRLKAWDLGQYQRGVKDKLTPEGANA